jgi:N,N-dimethylformamidase
MHSIDSARLDLAMQYKRNPFGPYSDELQKVLKIMHWSDIHKRFITVQPQANGAWYLGCTCGGRGVSLDVYMDHAYDDIGQARWAVFRKRWQQLTGSLPIIDEGDDIDPASGEITPSAQLVRNTLTGYTDKFTARAGDTIEFKVSSDLPGEYTANIVRLRCGDKANVGFKQTLVGDAIAGTYCARSQAICPGSYVHIGEAPELHELSIQVSVWPTMPGGREQFIGGCWDSVAGSGAALLMDANGMPALVVGDGRTQQRLTLDAPLLERHWYRLAASVDVKRGELWLACSPLATFPGVPGAASALEPLTLEPQSLAPLRLAAASDLSRRHGSGIGSAPTPRGVNHFNGKLEAPSLYVEAVPSAQRDIFVESGCWTTSARALYAQWDFSRAQSGTRIVDVSSHGRDGETVNMPSRAMKGLQWDGSEYNWSQRPEHYAAIHFHDDDLHDCAWDTDFRWVVPEGLRSGLYAAHLQHGELEDWIPFVVSPPVGCAHAPLALLLPTASYWAYANRGSIIDYEGREHVRNTFCSADASALYLHHHPELGLSMYDTHSDGSGVCVSSRLRPVLSLRPQEILWQLPADTHLTDWLEAMDFDYDVITEDDLDIHGVELLAPYRCVMTGTHPEYPSLSMMDAYRDYQGAGGRFMYMGGNGFYWRVSYHPELPGLMEMRRGEDGIRAWLAEGGEYYHAFTGELGGMWRRMGRAPQSVAGAGMTAQGFDRSTYYERTPDSHDPRVRFMFEGIGADERIGDFGTIGGGAAGWEVDRADPALGTPPHALVVAQATQFTSAYHWMKEELNHTHAAITGDTCPLVRCDMMFYETNGGGAVFSASSIAYAGSLSHNNYENNVSKLTRNVVNRFLDPALF